MPANSKILKRVSANLAICAASLILSLISLELTLRIFFPVYDPRGMLDYKYYPEDGVMLCLKNSTRRLWKNTGDYNVEVKVNRDGFRDKKDLADSTYNDIFVLGDSMGLGWGVEEDRRFSDLLEVMCGIPVYNISAPAGEVNIYAKLLRYAQKKKAKIRNLVLVICMENDLWDYDALERKFRKVALPDARRQRFSLRKNFHFGFDKFILWLRRNSATFHACAALGHQNDFLCRIALKAGWIRSNYPHIYKKEDSKRFIVSTAGRVIALSRPFNAFITIIPSRGIWLGDNRPAEIAIHEKFTSLLRESGARIVDLRDDFEKTGAPLEHYFKNDGHLNEKGHLAVALALFGIPREPGKN